MKHTWKRLVSFLLCLVMVAALLPVQTWAEEMVYLIENEEDFYAIMDDPYASYRLEADLDLGLMPGPLGWETQGWFYGSLDGNGHSIRYALRTIDGWFNYGLFNVLSGAEITNLTIYPDIQLTMPAEQMHYTVSPLCSWNDDSIVTGVTVDGAIAVSGGCAGSELDLYSLTACGQGSGSAAGCRVNVDIDVQLTADTKVEYWGLNGAPAYYCELYGDVYIAGRIAQMYQLYNAQDCIASQNLELVPSYIDFRLDCFGSFNYLENTITIHGYPGIENVTGWTSLLDNSKGSYFAGTVEIRDCSPQFSAAFKCEGVELECDLTTVNSGSYTCGLSQTTDSVFRGNSYRQGGTASYDGMAGCQRCLYVGDITQEAPTGGYTCGAIQSSDCVFEGDIYSRVTTGNQGSSANGLSGCQDCSFTGDIHVVSGYFAGVAGAGGGSDCIVLGDLTAEGSTNSQVSMVSDDSYYEGTVRANHVLGIGSNSSVKANIYAGQEVRLISGSNSYFSGNVSMDYNTVRLYAYGGSNNVVNANIDMTARAKWDGNWNNNAIGTYVIFDTDSGQNNSFSGSATVRTSGGVTVRGDFPITVQHTKIGTWNTGNAQGVWRHKDGICEGNCPGTYVTSLSNLEYQQRSHYVNVIYISSSTTNVSAGDASAGWDGSIDIEGRYEPERENADYGIQLTDMLDQPIPGAKLILGGASYITDDGGCVYVENGPGVISPLEVQLKNTDGEYETVLTRGACYPIPDRTNVIRLEPVLDADLTFLASKDSQEGTGTASGGSANLAGQNQPTLSFPVKVDIEGSLGDKINFATKWDSEKERLYIALGTGGGDMDEPDQFDMAEYKKAVEGLDSNDYDTWSEANRTLAKMQKESAGIAFGTWDTKVLGYAEWEYQKQAQSWELYGGGMIVGAKGELRHVYPLWIPGAYGTLAIQGDLQTKVGLEQEEEASAKEVALGVSGTFNPKVRAEGALGAGLRTARLYMEVGLGAEMDTKLHFPFDNLADNLTINAVIDAFGEVNCMIYSNRITIAQLESKLWPQNDIAVQTLNSALASGDGFAIAPRAYANNAVMPLSEDGTAYLGLNSQSSYPYAEVSLLKLSNGKYLLVYTDDDLSRGSADRSTLRACIGQAVEGNLVWGEPVTIENDGTGDYGFAVAVSGNTAALLWQDSNIVFGDGDGITPEDMAKTVTLSQTILDCSGEIPVVGEISTVATAGSMPYFPTIYYDGSNTCAAWVTSSNPDPSVYLDDETETLWLSIGGEPGQTVVENQKNISAVALLDTDLFWSAGTQENTVLQKRGGDGSVTEVDSGNIRSLQSSGENLCYAKDDGLYYATSGGSLQQIDTGTGYDNILRLSADGSVYAAQLGTESSRICEIQNGKALPIGEYPGYLSSWDVCDSYIVTLVRSGFEETDTAAFFTEASQQIEASRLNELVCENPEAPTGSYVSYNADIFNDGYNAIETLPVTVTAADGTVLFDEFVSCSIQSGESGEVSFGFTVPEGFTAQDVTVTVGEHTQTESLGGSNLKVEARWSQAKPDGITVKIRNTGLGASSGTVTVADGSKTLYTGEVTVEEGQIESIWVPFGEIYQEADQLTVTLAEDSGAMYSYDNEATVSVTPLKLRVLRCGDLTLEPGESAQLQVTPWPMGATMTNLGFRSEDSGIVTVDEQGCVTAVSPGEGRITVTTLEGIRTEVTVTVPGEPTPTDPTDPEPTDPEPTDPTDPEPTDPEPTNPTEPEPTDPTEPSVPEKPENPFGDVQEGAYYYDAVQWAVEKGVTTGLTAKRFGPDENCTRGQIVTFLWRAAGEPAPKSSENPFADVKSGDFYYTAVLWAVEQGITTGLSRNTFGPNESCNRGQVATFLYRYAGKPSHSGNNPFTDVAEGAFYYDAVLWALENQVTTGLTARTFGPEQTCTRGQIVTFLYRAIAK